jgi:predicted transcriptional regulator
MPPSKRRRKIIGFYYLVGTPLLFIFSGVLFWVMSTFYATLILFVLALVYLYILLGAITYGPEQIRLVSIPGTTVPEEIIDLLKTTTIRGDLINVYLIAAVEKVTVPNQSNLAKYVMDNHNVISTQQNITKQYIVPLERMGIIHSASVSKEKAYKLTPKGEWCLTAIKTCFPRTNFYFYYRQYLGIMNLPEYPKVENEKTTTDFIRK